MLLSLPVLTTCQSASAQEPLPAPAPTTTLTLAQCLDLALQRQPRLAVERASQAATEDGLRGLDSLRAPTVIVPELPIRRRQACLGVTAAAAGVEQVERETVYAVTRAYLTVVFAREQERVARSVVDRLTATQETAQRQLKGGARDITDVDVNRATVYLRLARTKQIQAAQGVKRALVALREAIGLAPDCVLEVASGNLPEPAVIPNRDQALAHALSRRSELVRATIFADVACLEVEAQGTGVHKKLETFASGSDVHATPVPTGINSIELYRPGAVGPEMPAMLVGCRPERVKHAQSLHARARSVVDVTRNLIALEVEDAFLRWEEASLEAQEAKEAADLGDKVATDLSKDFTAGAKVKVEEVINSRVLAAQARATYNEFRYKQLVALADLERVTAGCFRAGLVEAAAPR